MRDFFDPNIFEIYHSLSWYFSRYNNLYISLLYFCEILYDLVQKKKKKENHNIYSNLRSNFKIENIKSSHWKKKSLLLITR